MTHASNFSCFSRSAEPAEVTTVSIPNWRKHSVSRYRDDSLRSTNAARAATFFVVAVCASAGAVPKALSMCEGPVCSTKVYCGLPRSRWKDPKGQFGGYKSVITRDGLVCKSLRKSRHAFSGRLRACFGKSMKAFD